MDPEKKTDPTTSREKAQKNLQNMIEDDSMQCNMDRIRYLSCSDTDEGGYVLTQTLFKAHNLSHY